MHRLLNLTSCPFLSPSKYACLTKQTTKHYKWENKLLLICRKYLYYITYLAQLHVKVGSLTYTSEGTQCWHSTVLSSYNQVRRTWFSVISMSYLYKILLPGPLTALCGLNCSVHGGISSVCCHNTISQPVFKPTNIVKIVCNIMLISIASAGRTSRECDMTTLFSNICIWNWLQDCIGTVEERRMLEYQVWNCNEHLIIFTWYKFTK